MGDTTMTEQWMPTTEVVRADWVRFQPRMRRMTEGSDARWGAEFDRWLAALKAEVAANALREAAAAVDMSHPSGPVTHRGWLRARADRIEREATNHKPNPELGSSERGA